jgi:hypothetical protein
MRSGVGGAWPNPGSLPDGVVLGALCPTATGLASVIVGAETSEELRTSAAATDTHLDDAQLKALTVRRYVRQVLVMRHQATPAAQLRVGRAVRS